MVVSERRPLREKNLSLSGSRGSKSIPGTRAYWILEGGRMASTYELFFLP